MFKREKPLFDPASKMIAGLGFFITFLLLIFASILSAYPLFVDWVGGESLDQFGSFLGGLGGFLLSPAVALLTLVFVLEQNNRSMEKMKAQHDTELLVIESSQKKDRLFSELERINALLIERTTKPCTSAGSIIEAIGCSKFSNAMINTRISNERHDGPHHVVVTYHGKKASALWGRQHASLVEIADVAELLGKVGDGYWLSKIENLAAKYRNDRDHLMQSLKDIGMCAKSWLKVFNDLQELGVDRLELVSLWLTVRDTLEACKKLGLISLAEYNSIAGGFNEIATDIFAADDNTYRVAVNA